MTPFAPKPLAQPIRLLEETQATYLCWSANQVHHGPRGIPSLTLTPHFFNSEGRAIRGPAVKPPPLTLAQVAAYYATPALEGELHDDWVTRTANAIRLPDYGLAVPPPPPPPGLVAAAMAPPPPAPASPSLAAPK